MTGRTLRVDDEFHEVATHAVDDRNRLTLGQLFKGTKRVRVYRNSRGELFLQPVVEVPAAELWLFQNGEALEIVRKGLEDATEGRTSKLSLDELQE